MRRFEEIEHTADWAFRAYGRNQSELFENAAFAMFSLEGAISAPETLSRHVDAHGIDYESLLVNWLGELVYLQETYRETYSRFVIEAMTSTSLTATVYGAPSVQLNKMVKAVTYHNLRVEETDQGWSATVVVDV